MMEMLYVIKPSRMSALLQQMLDSACKDIETNIITEDHPLPELKNKRLLFAVDLNEAGYCIPIIQIISKLYERADNALEGSTAALLISSPNEYNTKSIAADIIFQLNMLGCQFPGHPIVEAIAGLMNFKTWQKSLDLPLHEICLEQCTELGRRLMEFNVPKVDKPYVAALHASSSFTSNTLALWNMISKNIDGCVIEELHIENGEVVDCKGCTFKTCLHYSKQHSCFYGGVMVREIYPAIEKADAVVWICPNYNDAVSANISAVINRLTALYRTVSFSHKALYAVIVSGNSGSDSVAMQLIDALCINKGFYLPPNFCITAIANDPGAILGVPKIDRSAKQFAKSISKSWRR
jgi:multimeric flavodoxin WrbA